MAQKCDGQKLAELLQMVLAGKPRGFATKLAERLKVTGGAIHHWKSDDPKNWSPDGLAAGRILQIEKLIDEGFFGAEYAVKKENPVTQILDEIDIKIKKAEKTIEATIAERDRFNMQISDLQAELKRLFAAQMTIMDMYNTK